MEIVYKYTRAFMQVCSQALQIRTLIFRYLQVINGL